MSQPAERPTFFEGQYLGAADLTAMVAYAREHRARQDLGQATWGIAMGLELRERTAPDGSLEVLLTPGFAFDGYARQVVVREAVTLQASQFAGLGTGEFKVWLRFDANPTQGVRHGFEVCDSDDAYGRMQEGFAIELGERSGVSERQDGVTVANELVLDARLAPRAADDEGRVACDGSIPHQCFDDTLDDALWLIPVGFVHWNAATASIEALSTDQRIRARLFRRQLGQVTESLFAANGVLRLRDRFVDFEEDTDVDLLCGPGQMAQEDLRVCDERLHFDDLIWLEGNTRLEGHARLWGTRLEFRNTRGDDPVQRSVGGVPRDPSALLALTRGETAVGNADLQVLLQEAAAGEPRNRFIVSRVTVDGDECDYTVSAPSYLLGVQDDGRVGIGTFDPTSDLLAPLTIRAEGEFNQAIDFERSGGGLAWRINLQESGAHLSINEALVPDEAEGRLFLQAGGNVGISTTDPAAKLDIADVQVTPGGSGLGNDLWLRVGNGEDNGRLWVEYGSQRAPLLVLADDDDPPRLQFQQGDETSPTHSSWIGHARGGSANIALMGADLGIGTQDPTHRLHLRGDAPDVFLDLNGASPNTSVGVDFGANGSVESSMRWSETDGTLAFTSNGQTGLVLDGDHAGFGGVAPVTTVHIASGTDVTNNGSSGYLVLGSATGTNIGIDNNEIQCRANGSPTTLTVQAGGGHFAVGNRLRVQDNGDVGINTTSPDCRLHVRDTIDAAANDIASHVACVENASSGTNADVLALSVGAANPGTSNNYITFFAGGSPIGRIERDGGTLTLVSGGADLAECLPLAPGTPAVEAGDVVGVHQGQLRLETADAERVMVVTDRAAVVGNAHGDGTAPRVALMGQVPVKVRGPVHAGDLLLPSPAADGTAIALAPREVVPEQVEQIIGQAWASDDSAELKRINAAISFLPGLGHSALVQQLRRQEDRLQALEASLATLLAGGPQA
ncbi:MAG: hypothetical protein AAF184_14195 [Pseudomonadota bacterium]